MDKKSRIIKRHIPDYTDETPPPLKDSNTDKDKIKCVIYDLDVPNEKSDLDILPSNPEDIINTGCESLSKFIGKFSEHPQFVLDTEKEPVILRKIKYEENGHRFPIDGLLGEYIPKDKKYVIYKKGIEYTVNHFAWDFIEMIGKESWKKLIETHKFRVLNYCNSPQFYSLKP